MNWEVPTMKSRTSFFNAGVAKNLLRRFWPLWAAYFGVQLLILPGLTTHYWADWEGLAAAINQRLLSSAIGMVIVSFFMAPLTARLLLGYLFETRGCGMMNSLPLRRETVFGTVWLVGFGGMLLTNVAAVLLSFVQLAGFGMRLSTVLLWLLLVTCGNLCFFGVAVFTAQLTGSRGFYPFLYLLVNFAAALLATCVWELLRQMVYGLGGYPSLLYWFSPPCFTGWQVWR